MRKTLSLVLLVSAAPLARAQSPAGLEFQLNAFTTGAQALPSATADAAGRFVVAWQSEGQDGSGLGIVGRRLDPAGAPLGAEFVVNQYTTGDQSSASVAAAPDGRFLVTWSSLGQDGSGWGVFGRAFGASGQAAGPEFPINAYTTSDQRLSRAAAIPGGFVVVWQSSGQDGSGQGVFGRVYDLNGGAVSPEVGLSAATVGYQVQPVAAGLPNGGFVVAWLNSDFTRQHVFVRVYDTNGPLGPETQADTQILGGSHDFRSGVEIAADASGAFTVAWRLVGCFVGDGVFCTEGGVQAREYAASGTPMGAEFVVDQAPGSLTYDPTLAIGDRGIRLGAWTSDEGDLCVPPGLCGPPYVSQDGSGAAVYARRFGAVLASSEFRVNTFTLGDQSTPAVASDPHGNTLIVWQSDAQDGSGLGIFGQRYGGLRPVALEVDTSGNRVLEPGETVVVRPSWRNASGGPQAFAGGLSNLTGPGGAVYTITDASASYGTVANDTSAPCVDCYGVSVSNPTSRPVTHWDASVAETITPDAQGQQARWLLHVGRSFADVPSSSPFYRFVETLLHRGVTSGCTATTYCPGSPTTREQMAAFVLLAKEGAGYLPPACAPPNLFNDVPETSPFCRYIEELSNRGVVGGCGGANYCPGSPVTREQMAIFVLRTLDPALSPPACAPPNLFNDVPETSPFCRWIEELTTRGVVSGCGGGNYCPTSPVTRDQMGVFISVTFGLTLYGV
jgi:hypothetical protein